MADLLIEVGCEELPSSACREIVEQAPGLFGAALAALGGPRETPVELSVAPRRFALLARGLPERLVPAPRVARGPSAQAAFGPDGAPTKAAQGFARSQGVPVEALEVREDEGGRRFVFAERREEGRTLDEALPLVAAGVVDGLRFGKTMRWGEGTGLRFSRPVRWIVAKIDERTVVFELHGLVAGDLSQGHRFLGGPTTVGAAADYAQALEASGVIASHARRRAEITAGLDAAAAAAGGSWSDPGGKLEEVLFLVEWPSVITGAIDPAHLRLPERVLVTAMQSHQRYFPLRADDGALLPAFLAVSNGDPAHAGVITRGNEAVLEARLQDAGFSFDRDLEAGLDALGARLDTIVFHKRLGTMADKRERLVVGTGEIAAAVGADGAATEAAAEAARLAKVDQGAVLVAEFSELEGYVGAEYARRAGVGEEVARAVEEQYLPLGPDSPAPSTLPGALLAAAEKLDNLVGNFAVGGAPTGSRDPYGLRRAATGLVRIALERGWDVDPCPLVEGAYERLAGQGADLSVDLDTTRDAVIAFLEERLAYLLTDAGVGAEAVAAAVDARLGSAPAVAAWARAIDRATGTAGFEAARTAATRLNRIARQAPQGVTPAPPDGDAGEAALATAIAAARGPIDEAHGRRDFDAALAAAEPLARAVDAFFVDVLVNADDEAVRARRYALVQEAAGVFARVAGFDRVTERGGAG